MNDRKFVHFITNHSTLEIPVEVASSAAEIAKGLMDRVFLPDGTGFLFEFGKETNQNFWMKDTEIPLSIAFFDANGTIIDIQDMEPHSTEPHSSPAPYVGALEVNQGFFEEHGIGVHDKIKVMDNHHPLRDGEIFTYGGEHAEALRLGLDDSVYGLVPWEDVNWEEVRLPRPRIIKSTRPKLRNYFGFKNITFIRKGKGIATPPHWGTLTHPSPSGLDRPDASPEELRAGRPITDPDRSFSNVNTYMAAHNVSYTKYKNKLAKLAESAIRRTIGKGDQLGFDRSVLANDLEPGALAELGGQMHGFSPHAMSTALSHFSPKTPMFGSGSGSRHGTTLDQTIMAMDIVGSLGSDQGMEFTQDHINQIKRFQDKIKEEIAKIRAIPEAKRKETHMRQLAGHEAHLAAMKHPERPGTAHITDFSDESIAAMITGPGVREEKLKAIKILTSEKRPGAQPLRITDLIRRENGVYKSVRQPDGSVADQTKYEIGLQSGPKLVSFADNIERPDESTLATMDVRMKSSLDLRHRPSDEDGYCNTSCKRDAPDYSRSTGADKKQEELEKTEKRDKFDTAGWDSIDVRSDKLGQGKWKGGEIWYGPGAGYKWQESALVDARSLLLEEDTPAAKSVLLYGANITLPRFQNLIWPETVRGGDFGNADSRALEEQRLSTPTDQWFRPAATREHDKTDGTGPGADLACRHTHKYYPLLNEIMKRRHAERGAIRSILQTAPSGSGGSGRLRIDIRDKGMGGTTTKPKSSPKKSPARKSPAKSKQKPTTKKTQTPKRQVVKKKVVKKSPAPKTLKPKG